MLGVCTLGNVTVSEQGLLPRSCRSRSFFLSCSLSLSLCLLSFISLSASIHPSLKVGLALDWIFLMFEVTNGDDLLLQYDSILLLDQFHKEKVVKKRTEFPFKYGERSGTIRGRWKTEDSRRLSSDRQSNRSKWHQLFWIKPVCHRRTSQRLMNKRMSLFNLPCGFI